MGATTSRVTDERYQSGQRYAILSTNTQKAQITEEFQTGTYFHHHHHHQ